MAEYWNHNTAYHSELLEAVPHRASRILDVGCGDGLLLQKFATKAASVTGIDPDPSAVARARARVSDTPHAHIIAGDVLTAPELDGRHFDLITCVATLHHMPLVTALERLRELLTPGGRLRIVGLSANKTVSDWIVSGSCPPHPNDEQDPSRSRLPRDGDRTTLRITCRDTRRCRIDAAGQPHSSAILLPLHAELVEATVYTDAVAENVRMRAWERQLDFRERTSAVAASSSDSIRSCGRYLRHATAIDPAAVRYRGFSKTCRTSCSDATRCWSRTTQIHTYTEMTNVCSHFPLVLPTGSNDDRNPVRERRRHRSVSTVRHERVGVPEHLGVRDELGCEHVGRQWSEVVNRCASGGDNDSKVRVAERVDRRANQRTEIEVRRGSLSDMYDAAPLEFGPPSRQLVRLHRSVHPQWTDEPDVGR
ncbi:class I SAM-dependent methyltransferase [Rhodococcus pyridinivorans]|nr:class I SAM-dependent methyltransferase [Rhodococcus pyridinivorans]UVT25507.1 class I SAM-dependent methyltransferase [Rhodococcus pyridinivorans]